MKSSSKFDPQALQKFLLAHFEKGVLAIIVVWFLVMAYFAVSRIATPKFTTTPTELEDAAARAEQQIKRTANEILEKDLNYPDYRTVAKNGWQPEAKYYASSRPWNAPLFPARRKRTDPLPFPLRGLISHADVGAFSVAGGAAAGTDARGSELRGFAWVVLTGLVPYADQDAAYKEAFKDNTRPSDKVEYLGFIVERTEVGDRGRESNLKTFKVAAEAIQEFKNQWPSPATEIAPTNVIDPVLTSVLPPLSNRAWDHRVLHPPEILHTTAQESAVPDKPVEKPAPKRATKDENDVFTRSAEKASEPTRTTPGSESPVTISGDGSKEAPFLLFRFFDLSVEPGKRYQYRVQLVLANPNHKDTKVEIGLLANPSSAGKKILLSDWSELTPVVTVPREDRLFALSVKQQRWAFDRQANLGMSKWLKAIGVTVTSEALAEHGQLTNYPKTAVKMPVAEERPLSAPADLMGLETGKPSKKKKDVTATDGRTVDFISNFLLLDMRGGELLGGLDRRASEPAEFLFLDADGRLVLRKELLDSAEFQRLKSGPTPGIAGDSGSTVVPTLPASGVDPADPLSGMDGGGSGRKPPRKPTPRPKP